MPKTVFRVRPPNYFVLLVGNGSTRSTKETTVLGFRTEYRCNILRGAQALVIFHFQKAFASVVFYGKGVRLIPRLEVLAKF